MPAAPIDITAMVKAGLMRRAKGGVKLLGGGEFKAKASFSVYRASKSAVEAIEKAGGSVKILAAPKVVSDDEPRGKNKRMALEAAKGGDKGGGKGDGKGKGGKPKPRPRPRARRKPKARPSPSNAFKTARKRLFTVL